MQTIKGCPQHYAWGDTAAIPAILGVPPDGRPWAEWWLGTHPQGPAQLSAGGALADVSGELPYLLKLLAAAQPLSLQTHPTERQATAGFNRERREGIDHDSRLYRDPYAKPELLCALSTFDALCGFRPISATVALLERMGLSKVATFLASEGLEATVTGLYRGNLDYGTIIETCHTQLSPAGELVTQLAQLYPDDPSVVVTLLLNRVQLQRGEAIFLGPGNLHAYLSGTAVEVMGASDNVIRGGLTTKPVDVDELLRVLHFEALEEPVIAPVEAAEGQWRYPVVDAPFEVWRFEVVGSLAHTAASRELLLCTDGDSGALGRGEAAYLARGESVVLKGPSTVFCVTESPTDAS